MKVFKSRPRNFKNDSGQGVAEFIIICILIAVVVLGSLKLFGRAIICEFVSVSAEDGTVGDNGCGVPPPEEFSGDSEGGYPLSSPATAAETFAATDPKAHPYSNEFALSK